jgi:ribosome recycling factor
VVNDVLGELKSHMDKVLDALKRDLLRLRTGRANLALLDGIRVDYYGTQSPLNQVASLQVADPRLIVVKPWDRSATQAIEKAIRSSNLGLNPASDGETIRVPIPQLTEERRRDLTKVARQAAEEARVALRTHRREANDLLKGFCDDGEISEDDLRTGQKKVQDLTDQYNKKVDEIVEKKEKEILEV